jgi:excisionase family DNA binding protein
VKPAIDRFTPYDQLPEQLTIEEYAAAAGISRWLAYEMVRKRKVASKKYGRLLRIPKSALLISDSPATKLRRT